jgi:hypothetical protein
MRVAIVEIERPALPAREAALLDLEPRLSAHHHGLSVDHLEGNAASLAQDRLHAEVGDIQVQIPVAVHVSESQ